MSFTRQIYGLRSLPLRYEIRYEIEILRNVAYSGFLIRKYISIDGRLLGFMNGVVEAVESFEPSSNVS